MHNHHREQLQEKIQHLFFDHLQLGGERLEALITTYLNVNRRDHDLMLIARIGYREEQARHINELEIESYATYEHANTNTNTYTYTAALREKIKTSEYIIHTCVDKKFLPILHDELPLHRDSLGPGENENRVSFMW
jgi:hypothetical protein